MVTKVEAGKVPENNGGILRVDPSELMRDNPAALIVNRESYSRIDAHFSALRFDPPQVTWVRTFSSAHGEVKKLFVLDGMTRTKWSADNKDENPNPDPEFSEFSLKAIPVRDVTQSTLFDESIVLPSERAGEQDSLTMLQYLRAVVPPTVIHTEIAADRIAAHGINAWENMVGEEIAQKFSAIAALNFLDTQQVPITTDDRLRRSLEAQGEFIAGETTEERRRIISSLVEMGSIIRQTKLLKRQILEAAYVLVSAGAPVIGGEKEAYKQVYGLLFTPEVNNKLEQASSNPSEHELLREHLGKTLQAALARQAAISSTPSPVNTTFIEALRDRDISLQAITTVLSSDTPLETYHQIKREANVQVLTQAYLETKREKKLNAIETVLLNKLGGITFLHQPEVVTLTKTIARANDAVIALEQRMQQLEEQRDALIQRGVNPLTLDEVRQRLQGTQGELISGSSSQVISRKITEAQQLLVTQERIINKELKIATVRNLVTQVYAQELEGERFPQQAQAGIVRWVYTEVDPSNTLDTINSSSVIAHLQQLKRLDSDLQASVVNRHVTLSTALQRQRERSTAPLIVINGENLATQEEAKESTLPSQAQPSTKIAEVTDTQAQVTEIPIPTSAEEATNIRIEFGSNTLTKAVQLFTTSLEGIDVNGGELSHEAKAALDVLLRRLGKTFYNHPDIVRVIETDYPRLLEQVIKAQEVKIHIDREETDRDTRTRR